MKLLRAGKVKPTKVKCSCGAVMSVLPKDWKNGTYGGEKIIECMACDREIVKEGTEYQGDF